MSLVGGTNFLFIFISQVFLFLFPKSLSSLTSEVKIFGKIKIDKHILGVADATLFYT